MARCLYNSDFATFLYPDTKEMHEYEDYLASPTIGTASEFISRAVEDNAEAFLSKKTYADYIATRPRAQRFGTHGLFTDDGTEIELTNVSEELNTHRGNVWTAIVSLRREDSERLGFDDGIRWRDMLRGQRDELAKNLKIPPENLRWFAAFHNESYHPHVHILTKEKQSDVVVLDMPLPDTRQGKDLTGTLIADIVLQLLSYVAQTEREFIKQRQREGIEAARANGVHLGRAAMERPDNYEEVKNEWISGLISTREAGRLLGISHTGFKKWVARDTSTTNNSTISKIG